VPYTLNGGGATGNFWKAFIGGATWLAAAKGVDVADPAGEVYDKGVPEVEVWALAAAAALAAEVGEDEKTEDEGSVAWMLVGGGEARKRDGE